MALDRVGTPTGQRGWISWQDWLQHAATCNNSQIETNKRRLNIGEDDWRIKQIRAEANVQKAGDLIDQLLQQAEA